ncbi:MAG: GNAT family N-acetyltransferase [Patescibacteria group bacterium]
MKILTDFQTKSGRKIEVIAPSHKHLFALVEFVNRLIQEDTFLTLTGRLKTYGEERHWLEQTLKNIDLGKTFLIWAIFENKIVGQADIERGKAGVRDWHVGKIGLMVDQDFRRDGIGEFLLKFILNQAKQMKIKIAILDIFSDNKAGISLYEKLGFNEYGRLPKGLLRKGRYSDDIEMYLEISSLAKATRDK